MSDDMQLDPSIATLIDAYVLGIAEDSEIAFVESLAATDPQVAATLLQARVATDHLLHSAPPQTPPPSLRAKVLARVQAEAAKTTTPLEVVDSIPIPATKPGFWDWLLGRPARDNDASSVLLTKLLSLPTSRVWTVSGTESAPTATARLVGVPGEREGVLVTNGLPSLTAEQAYQIWFLRDGKPIPNALFQVNRSGRGQRIVRVPASIGSFDVIAITPEPITGSQAPTGPIVLAGELAA